MKILHILQSNRFSGAENVVCQIIKMLENDPNTEMVYSSTDGQIREALTERGIRFAPMRKLTLREAKRVIDEEKPDIIHAHDMAASFYVSLTCGNIPFVSHIHNNNFDSRKISLKSILYYYVAKKAKHIFWVSQSSYDGYIFHDRLKNKSEVLYNIIDIDDLFKKMECDKSDYDYDIVYLGRLTPQKNPHRLMRVFDIIIKRMPNVKIGVIGTGELEDEIHKLAMDKDLMNNVSFLGFMNNPYKILHDAKLMIMTSRWEGTPMCVLEAMALGVPVVSTPTDGISVVVEDKISGFLSDSDEVIALRCCDLVADIDLRNKMSSNAKKRVSTLMDKDMYREKIISAYRN